MYGIEKGQRVLVVWGASAAAEKLQSFVEELQKLTGESGKVNLENVDRVTIGGFYNSDHNLQI